MRSKNGERGAQHETKRFARSHLFLKRRPSSVRLRAVLQPIRKVDYYGLVGMYLAIGVQAVLSELPRAVCCLTSQKPIANYIEGAEAAESQFSACKRPPSKARCQRSRKNVEI